MIKTDADFWNIITNWSDAMQQDIAFAQNYFGGYEGWIQVSLANAISKQVQVFLRELPYEARSTNKYIADFGLLLPLQNNPDAASYSLWELKAVPSGIRNRSEIKTKIQKDYDKYKDVGMDQITVGTGNTAESGFPIGLNFFVYYPGNVKDDVESVLNELNTAYDASLEGTHSIVDQATNGINIAWMSFPSNGN